MALNNTHSDWKFLASSVCESYLVIHVSLLFHIVGCNDSIDTVTKVQLNSTIFKHSHKRGGIINLSYVLVMVNMPKKQHFHLSVASQLAAA